jgi:hypothetical protein
LGFRREQASLLGERSTSVSILEVGEDSRGLGGVTGLRSSVKLVVQRRGLRCLFALPPIPAVERCDGAEADDEQPRDQVAVLGPERFQGVELFLFFEIEMRGHLGMERNARLSLAQLGRPGGRIGQ